MMLFHHLMQEKSVGTVNTILSNSPMLPKLISNMSHAWIYFKKTGK